MSTEPNSFENEASSIPSADDEPYSDELRTLHANILVRYAAGVGADEENRRLHTEDLRFVYDSELQGQWDPLVLSMRQGRPSYTFNRVLQPVNMVLGDQRQTRPGLKVRPADENAKQETAEVLSGMWRAIEQDSRAETIYDGCYKHAVAGGFGEMMILPQYKSDESFDQVLRILEISNPLTVVRDPESTDPCGADAMWCMVGKRISKDKYGELYPGRDPTMFQISRDSLGWFTDGMVRIVDYFERFPIKKEIALLSDGRVIDWTNKEKAVEKHLKGRDGAQGATVERTKRVTSWKVRWCKADGGGIIEKPIIYDWKRIPVVKMPGRYINIEGRQKYQSLVRHSKDAQRAYNFQASDAIERSALVPKARYLISPKMLNGFEDIWNTANTVPRIYLPYNVDKDAPNGGMPYREQPIDVPAGAVAMAEKAAGDIQATTGMFDPALGNADDMNRVSGKALVTHTRRSDLGTHEFIDNYGKAIQLLCEMGLDMIRTTYDSARIERIVKADGSDEMVPINQPGDDGQVVHDITTGNYSCAVTLGPSYETARQETLATLIDACAAIPALANIAPDLIAANIDTPSADELVRRLRIVLIHQGIIQPTDAEKAKMPPPPPPDPLKQAEVARAQALAQKDGASAMVEHAKAMNSGVMSRKELAETIKLEIENILGAQEVTAGHPNALLAHLQTQAMAGGVQPPQPPPGLVGAEPPPTPSGP